MRFGAAPILGLLIATQSAALAGSSAAENQARTTPSGLPVPRYVSLKFETVNARAGPSDDHRLLWAYHAKGLPVQVVAETADWRRICDPDGSVSWVHKRTTDARRTVMRLEQSPLALRSKPADTARVAAYLAPRALATLDRCEKDWCKVHVGRDVGWTPSSAIWGTNPSPQCLKPPAH